MTLADDYCMSAKHSRFAIVASWPIAFLLAALSLGGLLSSAYSRETPAWTAEATGVDWFDLLIAVPWIAICALGARKGSYRWSVLLAGAYAYTVYEMFIYAFAIHFNALFLVYCATLGLSGYALVVIAIELSQRIEHVDERGAHLASGFLIALAAAFGLLWLAEDVPAMLRSAPSRSLVKTGLFTHPVHVIDLSFVLPAHILAGVLLWKCRASGELLAPIALAFDVLMAASIGGMLIVMHAQGAEAPALVTIAMFVVAAFSAAVLVRVLRRRQLETVVPGTP